MKKLLIGIGILALVFVGAIVVVFFVAKGKFGPYAESVLAECEAGAYQKVYDEAAPAFRASTSFDTFRGYMEERRRVLGSYRRVARTTGGGMGTSSSGPSTGKVSMDLEYEKGTAKGEFAFEKDGDTWRLLSMKIDPDTPGSTSTSSPAPPDAPIR